MPLKDNFVLPNDPILIQTAELIEEISSSETKATIERMLNMAYGEQKDKDKPLLVGLAAPQVGISKRIILVDVKADGKGTVGDLSVFINPEIVWSSTTEDEWYEACYSTSSVCGIVSRPQKIKLRAYTTESKLIEQEYEGYTARIFQHEVDHLDGKEFVTHIINDDNLHWVEDDEFPQYRNNQGWRNWRNKCPREKWEQIKGITET